MREIPRGGRLVRTGAWKLPVDGPAALRGTGVEGDEQADRKVHGGFHKAVYAYAREDTDWWEAELARQLPHGVFGENLTLRGVDVTGSVIGERWRVGSALLEVSEPRFPCWVLGARFGDPGMVKRFAAARRPGAYLRIVDEGQVEAGDSLEMVERPAHDLTIAVFADAYLGDRSQLSRLLRAEVSEQWQEWARERAA